MPAHAYELAHRRIRSRPVYTALRIPAGHVSGEVSMRRTVLGVFLLGLIGAGVAGYACMAEEVSGPIEPVSNGQKFSFYTDGVLVHTYTDTQANWADKADPDNRFDIAVNLAVGGNWVGEPDGVLGELPEINRCSKGGTYPGGCNSSGIRRWSGQETYEVDYVRVFTR